MKQILVNTIKITAAAVIAILLAQLLHIENSIAAGIVAILTILPTKKETLKTAINRGLAFIIALIIAAISFYIFGFTTFGFFIYVGVFVLICQYFSWYSAMAMNSVIISHFLAFNDMSGAHLVNEIAIFIIGVGIGILANLDLSKDHERMEEYRKEADTQIQNILYRMAKKLPEEDKSDYSGDCFKQLDEAIYKAEEMAKTNFANQFRHDDTYDLKYIEMRKKQRQVLMEMYNLVRSIHSKPHTLDHLSLFLEETASSYSKNNSVEDLLLKLGEIEVAMKEQPLPTTRKEFEDRALLYVLIQQLWEFLSLKASFWIENDICMLD